MRNKRLLAILAFFLIAAGIFAGYHYRIDRLGTAMITWADWLKLNNTMYYRDHDADVIDPSCVGSCLGVVRFNVAQHVHNPEYHFRNGDATFLVEGTELFSSSCGDTDSVLVVQDGTVLRYVPLDDE